MTAMQTAPRTVSAFGVWVMAVRPRTLSLSIVPVLVGLCLAWVETGRIDWVVGVAALVGAMGIQVGTNLHNDAADFEHGGDGPLRLGPPRVTALGLLSAAQVKRGAYLCFGLAAASGLILVQSGGWPILGVGIVAILAGLAYSAGPWRIAYSPLGELFVVLFFGIVAVGATYWLNARNLNPAAWIAGTAIGLFAAAVLLVNNHRDVESDALVGRRTLAMVAGPRLTPLIYDALVLLPFGLVAALGALLPAGHPWWLAYGALPIALLLVKGFAGHPRARGLNLYLARTAMLQLAFGLLLCVGLLL